MNHYFYQVLYLRQKSPIGKEDCRKSGFVGIAAEGNTLLCHNKIKYLDPYPEAPLSNSSSSEDGAQGVPTKRSCSATGASRPGFSPHKIIQGRSFQNHSMSTTSFVFPKEIGRVLLLQSSLPAAHHQLFFFHLLLLCSDLNGSKLKKQLKYCLRGTSIMKFSHLLCQVWQSSRSDGAMKDTLPVVLNTLQDYDSSHRWEHVSAAMKGALQFLLLQSH